MKGKIRFSILVLLLIATCIYAAWESGLLLEGVKGILVQQLSSMMQAKISIDRIDVYGNFAVVKKLDIKHRDYQFSSSELILEYDIGKILSRKFDFIGGIRRVIFTKPKISFREMEWEEIKPLISPSCTGFFKFASRIQNTNVCFTKGRWELGSTSINNLYLNVDLNKREGNYIPVKLAMRGIFSAPKMDIPLNLKSEIKVEDKKIHLKGNVIMGDLPYTGRGVIKGSIFEPENPKILLDFAFSSRRLKFKDISLDEPRLITIMKGELGNVQSKGKFDAIKGNLYGQEIADLSFTFRDDTKSFEIQGEAKFDKGKLMLNKGIYKKGKNPGFEGDARISFEDYEIPLSVLYSGEALNIKKVSVEKKGEILLDGQGAGKLTKKRLSVTLKFEKGKYKGVLVGMDFPFAENLEKKLNISFGSASSIDVVFRINRNEIPFKLKSILSKFSTMDREISGNVNFTGKLKFKKTFMLEGEVVVSSLSYNVGVPTGKSALKILNSRARIKYDGKIVFLSPLLINGKEARGEARFQKGKCFLNIIYFFEPIISIQGEIAYGSKVLNFSALKINKIEVNGNVDLQDRGINLLINVDNENPALFINLSSVFMPALKKFKAEEEGSIRGTIQIAGLIDKPSIQGDIEYTGKVINSVKIEGLKYEGETLVFSLMVKWGESSLSANARTVFNKEKIYIDLNGGLNFILGKKENPAILIDAPFYLKGEMKDIQTFPQFLCEFGLKDPMINKKLGRSVMTSFRYSEDVLEFLPFESQYSQYYPVGKIIFGESSIKISEFSVYQGTIKRLFITGDIMPDEQNIDLNIEYKEDVNNLVLLFPQDISKAAGTIETKLNISGDFKDPLILGEFNIVQGEIAFRGVKEILKNVNARLNFETGVIKVDTRLDMGKTTLFLSGDMDYDKWVPTKLNLHFNNDFLKPLRVNIPGFVDGEVALSLGISGEASSPTVKGIVNIMNMSFTDWPKGEGGGFFGFLSQVKWDVDMVFKHNNRYCNDFVQAEVKRDSGFNLKWDGNYLFVKGRGEAERGSFIYMGVEFAVNKGSSYTVDTSLEDGIPQMRAYLDAKGTARVDRTTLILIFSGEMGKIEPVLTSEPPLSREEMLALINPDYAKLTGQQIDELLKEQAIAVLAGTLESRITKPLEKVVKRALRVDVFRIRSEIIKGIIKATSGAEITPLSALTPLEGSSVEIGKYIAENLYVDYKAVLQKEKVTSEWGVEYGFVRDMKVKYAFRPKEDLLKTEHEVFLEMSLRF